MIELAGIDPGKYAVGVSGGADSVALLFLLAARPDLDLHVAHLDHQTRDGESAKDAEFVAALACRLNLKCTVAERLDVERGIPDLPANRSARYRAARFTLFRQVCTNDELKGVILAHHAGDQAETVLSRVLRGSPVTGVTGMRQRTIIAGLEVWRPLLAVPKDDLRLYLASRQQPWREDTSNESNEYLRNRIRHVLNGNAKLSAALLELGSACSTVGDWLRDGSPPLGEDFPVTDLNHLPDILARESARRWIIARGVPEVDVDGAVVARILTMAADAASPPALNLPGGLVVRRRAGKIFVSA